MDQMFRILKNISSRKITIFVYVVGILILTDSFLMWRGNTYFSGRYNDKIYSDELPVASLLSEIKIPERVHVIFLSFLFGEDSKQIWREWNLLLTGNIPLYYKLPLISGMAMSFVPRYIAAFIGQFGLSYDADEKEVDFEKASLFGVSHVILFKKRNVWSIDADLVADGNGYKLYKLPKAGPRFYLVEKVRPFEFNYAGNRIDSSFINKNYDPVKFAFVSGEDFDLNEKSHIYEDGNHMDELSNTSYGNDYFSSQAGKLVLTGYDWEEVNFNAEILKSSLMVLTDSWYPGWKVFIDSKEKPLIRTNYIFRGVWLEPGKHIISFRYDNSFVKIGKILSIMGIIGIIIYGMLYKSHRRF